MNRLVRRALPVLLALLALLSVPVPSPAAAAPQTLVAPAVSREQVMEAQIFSQLNAARVEAGLRPLVRTRPLDHVAEVWSARMLRTGIFQHRADWRMWDPYRSWAYYGENIAMDPMASGPRFHQLWWNSPGHRKAMLTPAYTHVGIGVSCSGTRCYATQNFWSIPR